MKIIDIKVGDNFDFLGEKIRITAVEKTDLYIRITYDIIRLFDGFWSFFVFWRNRWYSDIETFKVVKNFETDEEG